MADRPDSTEEAGRDRDAELRQLRTRALKLLARREHTRTELRQKLAAEDADPADIETLLDELAGRGWLSDTRALEQVVHARRSRYGSRRIRQDLLARGVPEELIEEAAPRIAAGDFETARSVWRRKFKEPPANANERARQLRFLLGRGFSMETANRVLKTAADPDLAEE